MMFDIWMTSAGVIYSPSFMMSDLDFHVVLKLLPQQFRGCSVGVTDGRDLPEICR
jgi:hypothetical protein